LIQEYENMTKVETNDTVTLSFTGTLDNGEEFMVRDNANPLSIKIGESDLPPTIENGIIGLGVGEKRKLSVTPEEGYGPRQKSLLQTITNKAVIEKINAKPGMIVYLNTEREGQEVQVPATVIEVNENDVVIDYNHPLAGHNLNYEITIIDIEKGTN
jgi:FKBP-type peptidyl-prolyl cis-trans isomerase 2